jgi:hypothetical protein
MLGSTRDSERDGLPSIAADGDDQSGTPDDEDGIVFGSPLLVSQQSDQTGQVTVHSSGTARLDAWIDFDRNGVWDNASERIFTSRSVSGGDNALTFNVPAGTAAGATYARFRLSTEGGLDATGAAADGEVEDMLVTFVTSLSVDVSETHISENGGTATVTVTRPDATGDLMVHLLTNDATEATVAASVVIPDGQTTSAPAAIIAVDDDLLDGLQTVTVTASAGGYVDGSATLDVTDFEPLTVAIAADGIPEYGGLTSLTVARTDTGGPLRVYLHSNDTSEATVVGTVVIPDGAKNSPALAVSALDDSVVDGTQLVTISATAAGHIPGSDVLQVTDFERLTVAVADETIFENGGGTTATVTRTDTRGDLTVDLLSSDTTEATVAATVVIPEGAATSPPFAISAVDDGIVDGVRTVRVTADATGYVAGSDTVKVAEYQELTVEIGADAISENGGSSTVTVSRNHTTGTLTVHLLSDDTSEATVVATAVILHGENTSAPVAVNAVDDNVLDGLQTVTITATAAGYASASDALHVTDHEPLTVDIADAVISELGSTTVTISRDNTAGDMTVVLSSSDAGEAVIASTVVIPDGQATSPPVAITGVDDGIVDGRQFVAITASVPGFVTGQQMVEVADDRQLIVAFSEDAMSEYGGTAVLTVSRFSTSGDALVLLFNGDATEASAPNTVMILDGETTSAPLDVTAVDDPILDGTQTVTFTARASGYYAGTGSIDVTDHELLTLQIAADAIPEGGGATSATVTRTDTAGALTVNLSSNDTSEATVVATTVIPDGQASSAPVPISAVDEIYVDGSQTVTITASAVGYVDTSDTLDITDDDVPLYQNQTFAHDVDADGLISPADVVVLANRINMEGPGWLPIPPQPSDGPPPYVDPTGDDRITPADILLVLNFINDHGTSRVSDHLGEGEGPSGPAAREVQHVLVRHAWMPTERKQPARHLTADTTSSSVTTLGPHPLRVMDGPAPSGVLAAPTGVESGAEPMLQASQRPKEAFRATPVSSPLCLATPFDSSYAWAEIEHTLDALAADIARRS